MQQTIPQMVFDRIERFDQRPVMRQKKNGRYQDISWGTLGKQVDRFAAALLACDLKPEQQVAILAPNGPEWVYADLAIMSVRCRTVPIYHTEGIKTILRILADSLSRLLFVHSRLLAEEINMRQQSCPHQQQLVLLDGESSHPDILSLADFLALATADHFLDVANLRNAGNANELASLVYTSGTTGKPKGAMLTHANILSNVSGCCQRFQVDSSDECLSFLPLSHIFERTTGYYLMLRQGATITYAESIDTVAANLIEVRPTVLISVPRLYEKMYNRVLEKVTTGPWLKKQLFFFALMIGKAKVARAQCDLAPTMPQKLALAICERLIFNKITQRLGGRLRILISGGAPLSPVIAEFFLAAGISIYQGYGMTETSPVIAVNYAGKNRLGSVGQPLTGLELEIAADNELLVKGPSIFTGYWQQPQQTTDVLQDGWLHTGDLARLDNDNFLFITGRKKEIIVTAGGKNICPLELENELKADKFISNVMIYGDNRPYLIALIVPDFANLQRYANYKHIDFLDQRGLINAPHSLDLIRRRIAAIQQERPSYQRIKRFTLLGRDFSSEKGEVTQTLKIRRNQISAHYSQIIADLYRTHSASMHESAFCSIEKETALEKP